MYRTKVIIKFETEDGKPISSTEVECDEGQQGGVIRGICDYISADVEEYEEEGGICMCRQSDCPICKHNKTNCL